MTSLDSNNSSSAPNDALQLEDFIGKWRDSLGNQVRVGWAQQGNLTGELDVQLLRPHTNSRHRIHLNVKALGQGQFQCGHFQLKLDQSSVEKVVWGDMRIKGKVSVWERESDEDRTRSRSRSRSPSQRKNCGCVLVGRVALRCFEHLPLLPPRSVLHEISTPGAWVPPSKVPETMEKESEADKLFEAYDQILTDVAAELQRPQTSSLDEANAKLLAKHFEKPAVSEAEEKLVPDMLGNQQIVQSSIAPEGGPKDPRIRRGVVVVAPTGGA